MPWPNFSELSFGVSFLREFERLYTRGGSFPSAPDFITPADEATKGHDVEVALDGGVPVFFQFKRSYVLTTNAATEIQDGHFPGPRLFRMNLRKKESFRQHLALQRTESLGNEVLYVTSQISDSSELNSAFVRQKIIDEATALFSPNEIVLPDLVQKHHVTFQADASYGYVFSKEPVRFERSFRTPDQLFSRLANLGRDAETNRKRLLRFVEEVLPLSPPGIRTIVRRLDDPVAQASTAALLALDAHMVIFNPAPKKVRLRLRKKPG